MEKYRDSSLSPAERARDLVSRMTVEERMEQLLSAAPAIERLGVPEYNWWNEALHGVARAGTATMFPQSIALAATFDRDTVRRAADITSTEARIKYNEYSREGDRTIYKGLTFWSPNVNIFRDPRWGRGQETYGEDPYLTSRMGVEYVRGLQGDDPKYLKTAACAKHFAVHSGPESERHTFNAESNAKDLWETYLPAFEACVKEAKVEAVMGAYNRTNGEVCCASPTLMGEILRGKWGFEGHFVSDCGAIADFHANHRVTETPVESAALALKEGCDVNCGATYAYLPDALRAGIVTEEQITRACERLMTTRFKLGMFDETPQFDYDYSLLDCPEHRAAALETARRSMVLLKNDGMLPLDRDVLGTLAVIGPNAASFVALEGNYHGTAGEYITALEGIRRAAGDRVRILYAEGCPLFARPERPLANGSRAEEERTEQAMHSLMRVMHGQGTRISEAVSTARHADAVVLVLGLDETVEGEQGDEMSGTAETFEGDKLTLSLPKPQRELLDAVLAVGKPTTVVIMSGSAVAVDDPRINATVQAWYPGGLGGAAIGELIFGDFSPSGRLPVTFYRSTDDLPDFHDYSMKNRTYRYFEGEPLYPFGFGLSYAAFEYSDMEIPARIVAGEPLEVSFTLKNIGSRRAADIAQLYIRDEESDTVRPIWSLCGFERIELDAGESRRITMTVAPQSMQTVLENGERVIEEGRFTLFVGGSQPDSRSAALGAAKVISAGFEVR